MSVTVRWIAAVMLFIGAALYVPGVAGFAMLAAGLLVMPVAAMQKFFSGKAGEKAKAVLIAVLLIAAIFFAPNGGFLINAVEYGLVPKQQYVLNINSMRFHLPECEGVKDIKPENRRERTATREELIEEEYIPCGKCAP